MRIKATLLVTVGVLLCSLATIELSEFVRLLDDTSNDFTLVASQEAEGAVIRNQRSRVAFDSVIPAFTRSDDNWFARRCASHLPSLSNNDLLHSFCIHRT